tara:strand:+ start:349 stop:582 length:234 start_codon:yes stop_codon:yes gene_type:complete
MKLTKNELKEIIKQEIENLNEQNASEWTIMYKGLLSGFRKSKFKNLENVAKAVGFLIKTEYGSGAKNDFIKAIKKLK